MNKNNSNKHDIHDQLINLVTTLTSVIEPLRVLINQADDAVATRLDTSLGRIDGTVDDIAAAIETLGDTASTTSEALSEYQQLILKQLQAAVTAFTDNEMPRRYDDKIEPLINDVKQQVDDALALVVAAKNNSLEAQVTAMQGVADKLGDSAASLTLFTSQYQTGHEQIIKDIETFETATQERIGQVKDKADKDLDKIYKSIESMSIKKIAAAVAAGTAAMIISIVALVFWYVPSFDEIAELRSQKAELQYGIEELKVGWKQAFEEAQSQQFIFSCNPNEDKPDLIRWCVRADSKSYLRSDNGLIYYKISELTRKTSVE